MNNQPSKKLLQANNTQINQKKIQNNQRIMQLLKTTNEKMDTKTQKKILNPQQLDNPLISKNLIILI